jgi:hydrogen cyanide synthase HcnA
MNRILTIEDDAVTAREIVAELTRNDHGQISGAYCGMGVCQCCLVKIDGRHKRRACQTLVRPGMHIETRTNRIAETEAP